MHEFSKGSRACSPGKFLNLDSLKCHFLDFGERFYRILMVRKRHCDISEALANVFALSPKLGGPHLAHSPLGAPGFSRSEPIVVTPLETDTSFSQGIFCQTNQCFLFYTSLMRDRPFNFLGGGGDLLLEGNFFLESLCARFFSLSITMYSTIYHSLFRSSFFQ